MSGNFWLSFLKSLRNTVASIVSGGQKIVPYALPIIAVASTYWYVTTYPLPSFLADFLKEDRPVSETPAPAVSKPAPVPDRVVERPPAPTPPAPRFGQRPPPVVLPDKPIERNIEAALDVMIAPGDRRSYQRRNPASRDVDFALLCSGFGGGLRNVLRLMDEIGREMNDPGSWGYRTVRAGDWPVFIDTDDGAAILKRASFASPPVEWWSCEQLAGRSGLNRYYLKLNMIRDGPAYLDF